ncbi:fimbrial protein [uncultured Cedecea sp.]|uniref:fimbrial protein n=1 Tax=uncultured Cedecea sp. TaxID=988762 RepID=UPI002636A9C1|nr:fimbrial protein [uncultured Cedecea sp.]
MSILHEHSLTPSRKSPFRFALLVGLLSLVAPSVFAEGEKNMSFKGTLIAPPPCKVDGSQTIEVNFGDRLGVNKIDGVAYAKPLEYRLECEDTSPHGWKLTLSLAGTAAPFDGDVFRTSSLGTDKANENNLGVRIYQANGTVFKPNSQLDITDAQNPPQLMAVPVKRSGSTLVEGGFETLVTLQADYQ